MNLLSEIFTIASFCLLICAKQDFGRLDQQKDDQAEAALEKALGEIRFRAIGNNAGEDAAIRHPEPPMAPPRASAEQMQNFTLSPSQPFSSSPSPILPVTVLINPARIEQPKQRNTPTLANFIVRPNESKRTNKFEFMPHFDRDNYDFMVPEGPPTEEDSLVAILTFFGHLNGQAPQFQIKSDQRGWFTVGEVTSSQEPNYFLSEVPILRRASANISWSDTDQGVYHFQVECAQGQMRSSAKVRVEVLPVRNYSHLEMEPTSSTSDATIGQNNESTVPLEVTASSPRVEEKQPMENRTIMPEVTTTESGMEVEVTTEQTVTDSAIIDEENQTTIAEDEEDEVLRKELEMLQSDPLGNEVNEVAENVTTESTAGDVEGTPMIDMKILGREEAQVLAMLEQQEGIESNKEEDGIDVPMPVEFEEGNFTLQVLLDGQQITKGHVQIQFAELPPLLHVPLPNLVVELLANDGQQQNNAIAEQRLVRLVLRPAGLLDIRPHYITEGDRAHLWVADPIKVAELAAASGTTGWSQQFKLYAQLVDGRGHPMEGHQPLALFNGQLTVHGKPMEAPRFTRPEGYEFAINETAKHGHVLGRLEMAAAKDDLVFTLYGQGAEHFRLESDGTLRLDCLHHQLNNSNDLPPSDEEILASQCLDKDSSGTEAFFLVAIASPSTSVGPSSEPVSITVKLEDVNDNPPKLELFIEQNATLTVVNGQLEEGPLMVSIRDADNWPQNRQNQLSLEGDCAPFFRINSLIGNPNTSSMVVFVVELAENGSLVDEGQCKRLTLMAHDQDGQEDRKTLQIHVKQTTRRFRFGSQVYERSMPVERMHAGTPIVQMQLMNAPKEAVLNYLIVEGNPGWLAIEPFGGNVFVAEVPKDGIAPGNYTLQVAAVDRESRRILAQARLQLEVPADESVHSDRHLHFPTPLIQKEIDGFEEGEQQNAFALLPLFEDGQEQLAKHVKLENVEAWDEAGQSVDVVKDALVYYPSNGTIRIDLAMIRQARSVHAHFGLDQPTGFEERQQERTLLLTLNLPTDPKKAEQRLRRLSRPRFVSPWQEGQPQIQVKIAEELPIGHPLMRLPAFIPITGDSVPLELEGPDADSFSVDAKNGEIRIARRLDFESMARFQQITLVANSSESDQPVRAQIQFELLDVDDVPPQIKPFTISGNERREIVLTDRIMHIQFEENAPAGLQLMQLELHDPDSRREHCELLGPQAHKFTLLPAINQLKRAKSTWILALAQDAELDREQQEQFGLVVRCVDFPGGNWAELPLLFSLVDQNDNRPSLGWAHQAQLFIPVPARDWPQGAAISRFWARDRDAGENGQVHFELGKSQSQVHEFFRIHPETGVLSAGERPLAELAEMLAGEPLELEVFAKDHGHPPLSSSVQVRILLEEDTAEGPRELRLLWPGVDDGPVELAEDAPVGRKVGKAEALWAGRGGDGGEILFRIAAIDGSNVSADTDTEQKMLRIDPRSGEIFTAAEFDYEQRTYWTFLVTAFSPNSDHEASALLQLHILNVDEQRPEFVHNTGGSFAAKPVIFWPDSFGTSDDEMFLGRVEAFDGDAAPFNGIAYSLIPKCSHPAILFIAANQSKVPIRVDRQNGAIWAKSGFPRWANVSAVQLCVLAIPSFERPAISGSLASTDTMPSSSLIRLQLVPTLNGQAIGPKLPWHLQQINNSHSLLEHRLGLQRIPINAAAMEAIGNSGMAHRKLNITLNSVIFTPYGHSSAGAQRIASLEPMRTLLAIDSNDAELRFDPAVVGALGEGFYRFGLAVREEGEEAKDAAIIYRNVNFLEDRHRLRFLFNESIHALGSNLTNFINELEQLLSIGREEGALRVFLSEPIRQPKIRSSVCFHLWSPLDAIIGLNETIRLASTNLPGQRPNDKLAALYDRYSLLNIEPCLGPDFAPNPPFQSPAGNGPIAMGAAHSREWLFWCSVAAIAMLIVFALAGYLCFVRSYREHLRRKCGDLLQGSDERSDSSPFHHYLNNKCSSASVFSVPEFIQAKSIMEAEYWRRNE